eukprot:7785882-Pyramimonas_sp.AAC.1
MSRGARWGMGPLAARAHGLRCARLYRGGWVSLSTWGAVGRGLRALGRPPALRLWAVLPPAACPLRLLLPGPPGRSPW